MNEFDRHVLSELDWREIFERRGSEADRHIKSNKDTVRIYEVEKKEIYYGHILDGFWAQPDANEPNKSGYIMESIVKRMESGELRQVFFVGSPGSGKTTGIEEFITFWVPSHPDRHLVVIKWEQALYIYLAQIGKDQSHNKDMTSGEWLEVVKIYIDLYKQAKLDADKDVGFGPHKGIVLGEVVGINFIDEFHDDEILKYIQETDPDTSCMLVIDSDLRLIGAEALFRHHIVTQVDPQNMNEGELKTAYEHVVDEVKKRYRVSIPEGMTKSEFGKIVYRYYTRVAGLETMQWVYENLWNKVISWANENPELALAIMSYLKLEPKSMKDIWRGNELIMQYLHKAYLFYYLYHELNLTINNAPLVDNMWNRQNMRSSKLQKHFNVLVDE